MDRGKDSNMAKVMLKLMESNIHIEIAELRACVPIEIGFDGRWYADKCPFIFFKLRGKINT